jgi:hypothetical protein
MSTPTASPALHPRFLLLVAAGIAVTVLAGVVYGRLTQRWGPVPDLVAAARQLHSFPTELGDWKLLKEDTINESVRRILNCAGDLNRQYVNRRSGDTISLAIVLGPAGPISVHTPEICYSSRAYSIATPRKQVLFTDHRGRSHAFWALTFHSNQVNADQLCVYYGWTSDGRWRAPESARFEFAGRPLLYKLQIAALAPPSQANTPSDSQDACAKFLTALLESGWDFAG